MPIYLKRFVALILVLTFFSTISGSSDDPEDKKGVNRGVKTVVVDAGHGGRDTGAPGKNALEKDIALKIALLTGKYIEENVKDVNVIYTRKTDVFVGLKERAEIANKNEADLLISIHVNAHTVSSAYGTLTLVLGQHRTDENFDVAVRENSVIILEEDHETIYEDYYNESTEYFIMYSLMQKTYFRQSIEFGNYVQNQFRDRAKRADRGVREQGLLVLAQASMPGVMIETGFISNPSEEKFLMSNKGQEIIASAIYRAFKEYKTNIESRSNFTIDSPEIDKEVPEVQYTPSPGELIFRVQIASSRNKIPTEPSSFKGYKDVTIIEDGRWFKYVVGNNSEYQDALDQCTSIKKDFPDAFVIAAIDGKIIPLSEALILKNK